MNPVALELFVAWIPEEAAEWVQDVIFVLQVI